MSDGGSGGRRLEPATGTGIRQALESRDLSRINNSYLTSMKIEASAV